MRLLTWNLHAGVGGDGRLDLARIGAEIAALDPDLAALQEVDAYRPRSGHVNQWRELGRMTGLAAFYGSNLTEVGADADAPPGHPGRFVRQYGNCVLTRLAVQAVENHWLSDRAEGEGSREQRGCLQVDTPAATFLVTHWGLHAEERRAQSRDLLALADRAERPALVLGDLNAVSVSPEISALRERFRDAGAGAGPTSPADRPQRRIDFCFVPPTWRVSAARVVQSGASDHAALLIEVEPGP